MKTILEELASMDHFMILDTFGFESTILFKDPVHTFQGYQPSDFKKDMEEIEAWNLKGYYVVGFANYETFDSKINHSDKEEPTYFFGVFKDFIKINFDFNLFDLNIYFYNIYTNINFEEYLENLKYIKEEIISGRVYQVNHTFKLIFETQVDSLLFYLRIKNIFRTKYTALIRLSKDKELISFSPELFFKRDREKILVQPMKGTGISTERETLLSKKNRAENYMIVDLLRNDLGKVSENGSVKLQNLLQEETYGKLIQLTSEIHATLKQDCKFSTLIEALFPSGSITGAPKQEAMKIIKKIELDKRGGYTGMIGYLAPDFQSKFSVAIRTIFRNKNNYSLGIGGGIVYDSCPSLEWNEAMLKASFIFKTMNLKIFESILFKNKNFYYLNDHLDRMEKTSKILFGEFDRNLVHTQLMKLDLSETTKVKISIDFQLRINVNSTPIKKLRDGLVMIQNKSIEENNPLMVHKTNYRPIYDPDFSNKLESITDIIYYDSKENITEGCISNIFIMIDDIYYTPKLNSKILPGIFRKRLLNRFPNKFQEKTISLVELKRAKKIFICNSVRGIIRVTIYEK